LVGANLYIGNSNSPIILNPISGYCSNYCEYTYFGSNLKAGRIKLNSALGLGGSLIINEEFQNNSFTDADHDKLNGIDTDKINWISDVDTTTKTITTPYKINFNNDINFKGSVSADTSGILIQATGNAITVDSQTLLISSPIVLFQSPAGCGLFLSSGRYLALGNDNQVRAYSETLHNAALATTALATATANGIASRIHLISFNSNDWSPYGRPGLQPFEHSTTYSGTFDFNILNLPEFSSVVYNGTWVGGSKKLHFNYSVNLAINSSPLLICKSRFRVSRNGYLEGNSVFSGIQYSSTNTVTNVIMYEVSRIIPVVNGDIIYLSTNFNMTMKADSTFTNWYNLQISEL
jgi:hypothetical protein